MDYREELKEKYEILRALWVLLKSPVSAYNNNLFGSQYKDLFDQSTLAQMLVFLKKQSLTDQWGEPYD